jgi:hypothetical protein
MVSVNKTTSGRYEANDGMHFWVDNSPALAIIGLAVFNAVDASLPTDTAYWTEDERSEHWQAISKKILDSIKGV